MEFLDGRIFEDPVLPDVTPEERTKMYVQMPFKPAAKSPHLVKLGINQSYPQVALRHYDLGQVPPRRPCFREPRFLRQVLWLLQPPDCNLQHYIAVASVRQGQGDWRAQIGRAHV